MDISKQLSAQQKALAAHNQTLSGLKAEIEGSAMTPHSDGQWQAGYDSYTGKHYVDTAGDLPVICVEHHRGNERSNCRLMAAAPELLEACTLAMNELANSGQQDKPEYPTFQALCKAFDKAKGIQP